MSARPDGLALALVLFWQLIDYRMTALVCRCLMSLAPAYLVELCGPTLLSARSSHSLRSTEKRLTEKGILMVLFACTSIRQKRAFSVVRPSIWNGLHLTLRSLPP